MRDKVRRNLKLQGSLAQMMTGRNAETGDKYGAPEKCDKTDAIQKDTNDDKSIASGKISKNDATENGETGVKSAASRTISQNDASDT